MKEITGILNLVEIIKGYEGLRDIRINVGGDEFYKRIWEPKGRRVMRKFRPKNIIEMISEENAEVYDKEGFIRELQEGLGRKISVRFFDISTSPIYWLMDRLNGIKIPRKYREIDDFDYT